MNLLLVLLLFAQAFEVASVKPCREEAPGGRKGDGGESSAGRLHLTCQSAMSLLQWAYVNHAENRFDPLARVEISGGPRWVETERYQVDATAAGPRAAGILNGEMLRALLEERFGVRMRRVSKVVPVYALRVGKGGAKLARQREGSCAAFDGEHPAAAAEPGKPFPRICGMGQMTSAGYEAFGVSLAALGRLLSDWLDLPVQDRTGIAGTFDVHLDLTPADLKEPGAIREALGRVGLRLERSRGPVEPLAIERIRRPEAN